MFRLRSAMLLLLSLAPCIAGCRPSGHTVLNISAAASLTDSILAIEQVYVKEHPQVAFRNNFGASGTLSLQIEQGAPADIFLSAASQPMDQLAANHRLAQGTRRDLLRNDLVLIAPLQTHLSSFADLAANKVRLIAIGDPGSVPAGQYAQESLASQGLLDSLRSRLVYAKDVRQVLAYVETGNADAGLVYATDARKSARVRVVATAPPASHSPILCPVALLTESRSSHAARGFLEYLSTPSARRIFEQQGFSMAVP